MRRASLLLVLVVVACSPGPQSGSSPEATPQSTVGSASSPAPSTAPSPTVTTSPELSPPASPTAIAWTISGRATLRATGMPVSGVQIRAMPMPLNDGRLPGPEAGAVTDEAGAYRFTIQTWTLETLASSSSSQVWLQVTPPPGLLVLDVSRSMAGPPGTAIGNMTGTTLGDLNGPVDITLGPGHIVEGRVTNGVTSAPLAGVGVSALGPNSLLINGGVGDAFEIQAVATTDESGRYRLTVPTGIFAIRATGPQDGQSRFWSDDPAVFQASMLRVERDVSGVDLALVRVTSVAGYVRSGPSMGDGVEGARVTAFMGGGTGCCRRVGVAMSGGGGTFLMQLPRGAYRLLIEPPHGSPYSAKWWHAAAAFASATDMTVGSELIELEIQLAR